MNKDWKSIAELVGIAAIVASLFFVGLQMSQTRDVALSELSVAETANLIELTALIGEHSDIWVRGNAGDDLAIEEREIYDQLVSSRREMSRSAWRRNQNFGQEVFAQLNVAFFAAFLHRNPGARRSWMTRNDEMGATIEALYPDQEGTAISISRNPFRNAVLRDLGKLDRAAN